MRLFAGIAAIFYADAYATVQPGLGDSFNNEAIAACVWVVHLCLEVKRQFSGQLLEHLLLLYCKKVFYIWIPISYQYVLTGLIVLGAVIIDAENIKNGLIFGFIR